MLTVKLRAIPVLLLTWGIGTIRTSARPYPARFFRWRETSATLNPYRPEMASAENPALAPPHYIVRRSRSGRFNFTLITDAGRFTGNVSVPLDGRSSAEIEQHAHNKIRALAESFAKATGLTLNTEAELHPSEEEPSSHLFHLNAYG